MKKDDFIAEIRNEITISGMLPYDIPENEYIRIIDQAKLWFYNNYKNAVEIQYFVIENYWFTTEQFKKTRFIQLPECVYSVYECKEIKGGNRIGGYIGPEFNFNRMMAADLHFSAGASDDIVLRVAQWSFWDLTKAFILEHLNFDFNVNTKRIRILGRNPRHNVLLETYISIPEENLFDDYYFKRYCVSKCKQSLARMFSAFQFNLPGGITINADMWKSEADEELEKILTKIDEENTPDWFLVEN